MVLALPVFRDRAFTQHSALWTPSSKKKEERYNAPQGSHQRHEHQAPLSAQDHGA